LGGSVAHDDISTVQDVTEQPADQHVGRGAQQRAECAGYKNLEQVQTDPAIDVDAGHDLEGAKMMFAPGPGALAQVWLIGAYAAAVGVFRMMLSLRLRKLQPL